jgi:hypothetical protein
VLALFFVQLGLPLREGIAFHGEIRDGNEKAEGTLEDWQEVTP